VAVLGGWWHDALASATPRSPVVGSFGTTFAGPPLDALPQPAIATATAPAVTASDQDRLIPMRRVAA